MIDHYLDPDGQNAGFTLKSGSHLKPLFQECPQARTAFYTELNTQPPDTRWWKDTAPPQPVQVQYGSPQDWVDPKVPPDPHDDDGAEEFGNASSASSDEDQSLVDDPYEFGR